MLEAVGPIASGLIERIAAPARAAGSLHADASARTCLTVDGRRGCGPARAKDRRLQEDERRESLPALHRTHCSAFHAAGWGGGGTLLN